MDAKLRGLVTVLVDKRSTEQRRADAVRALHDRKKAGEAVPHFLEALEAGTPAVKTFVLRAIASVFAGDPAARKTYAHATIEACVRIATTKVTAKTDYKFLQGEAGQPLGALGSVALDAIVELAGHPDSAARGAAFNAIYWFRDAEREKAAKRLFPLVTRGLAHEDRATRRDAAFATRSWGALAAPLVPALVERLDDDDSRVRASTLETLADIGPEAAPAIPRLIALSKDKKHVYACVRALGAIGQDTEEIRAAFAAAEKLDALSVPDAVKEALAGFAKAKKRKRA